MLVNANLSKKRVLAADMRISKSILTLFLFCSLMLQVAGVQNVFSCKTARHAINSNSSSRNDDIDAFSFVDESLLNELEELEELKPQNEKKARKYLGQQAFFSGQMLFGSATKYKSRKNACKTGKFDSLHYKYIILLL